MGIGLSIDDEDLEEISTKHMNYEQLMARLGKKTLKVKIKERREKEKAGLQAEHVSSNAQGLENKSESDQQITGFLDEASAGESDFGNPREKRLKDPNVFEKPKENTHRRKGGNKQPDIGDLVSFYISFA